MNKWKITLYKAETIIITIICIAKSLPTIYKTILEVKKNVIEQREEILNKLKAYYAGMKATEELK